MNKEQKEVQQAFLNSEKNTIKELKQVYKDAMKDCQIKIMQLSARADLNPENLQSIIYQKNYQEAIKAQLEGTLSALQSDSYSTVSEYLTKCYQNGYIGTMYDIAGQGIPLIIPIDQNAVVKAIYTDSKLSTSLYAKMGEDVKSLKNSIRTELSRGIASGSTWNDIALRISSHNMDSTIDLFGFKKAYNNSLRIARTEGHRVQIQSAMDAQYNAKEHGADIVKQWDATLDGKTRDTHRMLDGQIREIDEDFEVGGVSVSAPAMFGDPAEDCNCRCALLQRARWALDEDELATLEERAEYFGLDKSDSFEEYKEKYLGISDEDIENNSESSIIELPNTSNCHYATNEQYTAEKKSCKKNVTKEDAEQIKKHEKADGSPGGYVATHNYSNINSNLRGDGFSLNKLDDDDIKTIESLRKAIQNNTLDDDYILTRYVNADYLTSVFGIKGKYNSRDDFSVLANSITQVANPYVVKTEIPRITGELKQWIGKTIEPDKAFVSTSMLKDKNIMQDKSVLLNIKALKGTHAYIPENRKESECILGENTVFAIENVEYSTIARKWIFDVVIVE